MSSSSSFTSTEPPPGSTTRADVAPESDPGGGFSPDPSPGHFASAQAIFLRELRGEVSSIYRTMLIGDLGEINRDIRPTIRVLDRSTKKIIEGPWGSDPTNPQAPQLLRDPTPTEAASVHFPAQTSTRPIIPVEFGPTDAAVASIVSSWPNSIHSPRLQCLGTNAYITGHLFGSSSIGPIGPNYSYLDPVSNSPHSPRPEDLHLTDSR